ncbi:MAG: hypothetical protein IT371_30705 [Deltaproteobacteria bacterium]|nr:hypothetical protein [Deltaproteobacteria bacterium]
MALERILRASPSRGATQQLGTGDTGYVPGDLQVDGALNGATTAQVVSLRLDDANVYSFGQFNTEYRSSGSPQAANEVQYTRVWLFAGRTIATMRTFVTAGADGVRQIQFGIYDQATPTSDSGTPNNRVANTAADTPPAAFTGVRSVALSASYSVPTTGWYWLAIQANNAAMSFLISDVFRANSVNRREENPGVFTLPATAGATTQPQSAALYCAAAE